MPNNRVIYLGSSAAIDANALEGFNPTDLDELLAAAVDSPHLTAKILRARDWEPEPAAVSFEDDEPAQDIHELISEALSEPTLGPASNRDAAQYWANLARKLARDLQVRVASIDAPTAS